MKLIHRYILFPITVAIRVVAMGPFLLMIKAGNVSETVFDWLSNTLPAYRDIP